MTDRRKLRTLTEMYSRNDIAWARAIVDDAFELPATTKAELPSAFAAQADADQHFAEITATAFPAAKGTCP
jgi:hypothetical protein